MAFYDGIHGKDCGYFICLHYEFSNFSFRKYVLKITFHYYYRQYFEVLFEVLGGRGARQARSPGRPGGRGRSGRLVLEGLGVVVRAV